jgi:hypothetical protein
MFGHTDIRMTPSRYGHLIAHGGTKLAESMEQRRERYRNRGDR